MRLNSRHARGVKTVKADRLDGFEELPQRIKVFLWEATLSINPGSVLAAYKQRRLNHSDSVAEKLTLSSLQRLLDDELYAYAGQFKSKHGHDLPHVAARATIQRYDARRRA